MKKQLLRFTLSAIIIYLTGFTLNPAVAATQPSVGNRTHYCGVIDGQSDKQHSDQYPNRRYARTTTANLNVGEPRMVRLIYFLPNDWQYRADVVQKMKDTIRTVQTFYAEQMGAHGYGEVTFRFETDLQGEPMVHRVDGDHPFSYYDNTLGNEVSGELQQAFDFNANIYFVVLGTDALRQGDGAPAEGVGHRFAKNGGVLLVPNEFSSNLVTHELGHTFGLNHDFRDGAYIMSYGPGWNRLSACAAEFLSVHSYFNPDTPIEEEQLPTIELISPRTYPPGSMSVPVRVQVSDSDGLHQVLLHALGALQMCRRLTGEKDVIVEFEYDGGLGLEGFMGLSSAVTHGIRVGIVDTDGNVSNTFFTLVEISPYHIATLEGHTDRVLSVSFSLDGTLASGSWDNAVKLWDVATRQNIATLWHTRRVKSVSFSPDGATLASGGNDEIKLWDVATRQNIVTLLGHRDFVNSVSFSRDGRTLASGGDDWTVKLWDVATQQNIVTLLGHTGGVRSVSFSPDGVTLASGSWDSTVNLWDVTTQQNIATLLHEEIVLSVSFSPDGTILASGGWGGIELWDVATETNFATLMHGGIVSSVSFSPDGETLASGGWDGTAKLWDMTTRVSFATFPHTSAIHSVSFSPDGGTLASGTSGGTVELWDTSGLMGVRLEATAEIDIPDPNLRAAIAEAIELPPNTPILRGHLENLTRLEARNANISDLTGLEGATNLRTLYLGDNNISDISAVAGLTNLTVLHFWNNSVSDISVVAGLTNLIALHLGNNSVSDISAVAGLTNLTELYLWNNSISDISAVAGLTNLTELHLGDSNISDISAVAGLTNLTFLYLGDSNISDISAVAGLTNLTELYLWNNSISDISAVAALTNLTSLWLQENNISDISPLVANAGLGSGDTVNVRRNSLSYQSIHTHIPTLQQRGVTVEFNNRTPAPPLKISGDDQQAAPGTTLEHPFVVEVRDQNGEVFAGVPVTFAITAGGGTLSVTNTIADANGRAQSILTLGPNPETNTISVSATRIAGSVTFHAISDIPFIEYILSIPAGTSLIHVPLRVTAVDKIEKIIESVGDLYDALGGASVVNFLITYDSATQGWLSYFVPSDKGSSADVALTDDKGIIVGLRTPVSIQLRGNPLGTDGNSAITLTPGINLVGLPLRDSRVRRVSHLFALDGIGGNVPVIILTDNGEFKAVGRADDPGDIAITGGQAFILTAQQAAQVTIAGQGWTNVSGVAAAPLVAEVTDTTPVLALRGAVVDERTGAHGEGFRVTVKNLSIGKAITGLTTGEAAGYRLTVVDTEMARAAMTGDVLEVSARSANPQIGVKPLRYTVTADDVRRSLIELPELVIYEIPAETKLLANYPNPFNPETWIPYRLASDGYVTLTIYDLSGRVVRTLDVGHRVAAVYESRSKAIYFDSRNQFGETVASGVYFYHLLAGDYSATQRMLIVK